MRESKSSRRATNDCDRSSSIQMELELAAARAKNAEVIKDNTKLKEENADLKNELISLKAELVRIQAKYNNLKFFRNSIEQNMRKCTPQIIDVLNLFLEVTDSRKTSFNMLNMSDRVSDRDNTQKSKVVTHTVKPHTVNGTVLNVCPTISLTRLNTSNGGNTNQQLNEVSSSSPNLDYSNSLPSTSAGEVNENNHDENVNLSLNTSEVGNQSFVSKRKITTSTPDIPLKDLEDDEAETNEQTSDESEDEEEQLHRLSTIQEESICSNGRSRRSLGEVRIYLSRLSAEEMRDRQSQNTSFSSTSANVNDTCLNIETTVIDNSDNQCSKRLRADIMVFSPHTNSTTMEGDNTLFNNQSHEDGSRKISLSAVSNIQSTEVTPSTSPLNYNDNLLSSNKMVRLPTPSMSALGDINESNTSKLEILKELGLTPSPLTRSNRNDENMDKASPVLPSTTPQRYTRSKSRTRSKSNNEIIIENINVKRSVKSLVNRRTGGSSDRPLTPTIVLERLENIIPAIGPVASAVNIKFVAQSDEPKENETPPKRKNSKAKKSKPKSKSKSPKRSCKRKISEVEEDVQQPSEVLREQIRDIQIRLSNLLPESPYSPKVKKENAEEDNHRRPARAARPKNLKDSSLKSKLRRT